MECTRPFALEEVDQVVRLALRNVLVLEDAPILSSCPLSTWSELDSLDLVDLATRIERGLKMEFQAIDWHELRPMRDRPIGDLVRYVYDLQQKLVSTTL